MRMPMMTRFTKKIGIVGAAVVALTLATPILPGMAGTAYACGDEGGGTKQVAGTTATQADWDKVSATLSGVPAKVIRGTAFTARLTITNNSKVELGRIPVNVGIGLLDNTVDAPDGMHHGGAKDVDIRYTLPGQARQVLTVSPGCDPFLGGDFVITGAGRPGSSTTVVLQVTVKVSTPVQVTTGQLGAGAIRGAMDYKTFTLGRVAPKPTTPAKPTPVKPTPAKPAPAKPAANKDDAKAAATTPPAAPSTPPATAALPAALPRTGGSAQTPALALGAAGLVLLGTTTIVLTRRRRPTA